MLQLGHRCLALRFAIDWRMLGRAQSAGNVGLMEALSYRIIGIRCVSAIGRIVLPVNVVSRQVFSCYMIEIIYINIDVIAIMRVIAVAVVVIVMVMVIIIQSILLNSACVVATPRLYPKPLTKLSVNCSPGGGGR